MTCSTPIPWEELVLYWAGDLSPARAESMEEHLIGCGPCTAQSSRVAAVVEGLRGLIPPVVTRDTLARLSERGMRIEENAFVPGRQTVVFRRQVDLLVHRLTGFDLSDAHRVHVAVRVESTGDLLLEDPNAPFDPQDGILIACQHHFAEVPHDILFEVSSFDGAGMERRASYSVPHIFER